MSQPPHGPAPFEPRPGTAADPGPATYSPIPGPPPPPPTVLPSEGPAFAPAPAPTTPPRSHPIHRVWPLLLGVACAVFAVGLAVAVLLGSGLIRIPGVQVVTSPSGVATNPTTTPTARPTLPAPNGVLADVEVSGDYPDQPTVKAAWPLVLAATEHKVLHQGKGTAITRADQEFTARYLVVNARTGKKVDSNFGDKPPTFALARLIAGAALSLRGRCEGDRILVGIASVDGYDSAGGLPGSDVQVGDTLIMVFDIVEVSA